MSAVVPDAHVVTILLSLAFVDLPVSRFALPDTTVFDRSLELSNNCFSASGLIPEGTTATSFCLQEAVVAVEPFANLTKSVPDSAASLGGVGVGGVLTEVTTACDDGAAPVVASNCDGSPCGTISPEEGLSDNTMPACGKAKRDTCKSVVDGD